MLGVKDIANQRSIMERRDANLALVEWCWCQWHICGAPAIVKWHWGQWSDWYPWAKRAGWPQCWSLTQVPQGLWVTPYWLDQCQLSVFIERLKTQGMNYLYCLMDELIYILLTLLSVPREGLGSASCSKVMSITWLGSGLVSCSKSMSITRSGSASYSKSMSINWPGTISASCSKSMSITWLAQAWQAAASQCLLSGWCCALII